MKTSIFSHIPCLLNGRRLRLQFVALACASLPFLSAVAGRADTLNVPIGNFSFENPASSTDQTTNDYHDTPTRNFYLQDWTFSLSNDAQYGTINYAADSIVSGGTGSQGMFMAPFYAYNNVFLTTGNATNNDGSAEGTLGYVASVAANTTYTLDVNVATPSNPNDGGGGYIQLSLIDSSGTTFATRYVNYPATSAFTTEELQYTTGATPSDLGQGFKIQIARLSNGDTDKLYLDNVLFSESGPNIVAPEPSTYALFGVGLALLAFGVRTFWRSPGLVD